MVDRLRRLKIAKRSTERFQNEGIDFFALQTDLVASNISYAPSGSLAGLNVQAALDELIADVDGLAGGGGGGGGSGSFLLDDGTASADGVFLFDDGTA